MSSEKHINYFRGLWRQILIVGQPCDGGREGGTRLSVRYFTHLKKCDLVSPWLNTCRRTAVAQSVTPVSQTEVSLHEERSN